jgi:hypothetical protein
MKNLITNKSMSLSRRRPELGIDFSGQETHMLSSAARGTGR